MNSYVMMHKPENSREIYFFAAYNYATNTGLTDPDLQASLRSGILNLSEQFYCMTTFARSLTYQVC